MWRSERASINCAVMRTRFAERVTVPSITASTPRSRAISGNGRFDCLYLLTEVCEMTCNCLNLARAVINSEVMPSLKYSWLGSEERFTRGKTAVAGGINNAGQVTGFYRDPPPGFIGFVEDHSSFQSFDIFPGADTEASGINNHGVVVGTAFESDFAFLETGGTFTELDYPGTPSTDAFGINDRGQVVGAFYDPSEPGLYRGYVATPVPEQGTLSLLVEAGLSCIVMTRVRRK
jgi:hypothetical protein